MINMDSMARTPKQIGAVVQRQRRQSKLTQSQLGAKIKLRQATVSKLEVGAPILLGTLLDVLAALNLEMVIRPRTQGSPQDIEDIF
jgi:HTH-type transcriptional regulator / antitoxin HipB